MQVCCCQSLRLAALPPPPQFKQYSSGLPVQQPLHGEIRACSVQQLIWCGTFVPGTAPYSVVVAHNQLPTATLLVRQGTLPEAAPHHATEPVDSLYQHSLLHDRSSYEEMYKESIERPARFWAKIARQYHWEQPVGPLAPCMRQGTVLAIQCFRSQSCCPCMSRM